MGTEKYPKENDYNQYLAEHSGHSNAFTGMENTNYYFEVGQEWLEGALDRFAQFFISPLFSDSCTERELKAVDSGELEGLHRRIVLYETGLTFFTPPIIRAQEKFAVGQLANFPAREIAEQSQPPILPFWNG